MRNEYDDNMDDSQVETAGSSEYDQEDAGASDRRVSSEPVPSFPYYILAPRGATLAFSFDDKNKPVGRHRFEVVEGPEGTVGATLFADQPLYARFEEWTPEKDANGRAIMKPLSAEDLAEEFRKFNRTMTRVQQAFGLAARMPKNKTAVALGAYLGQFDADATPAPKNIVADVKRKTKNGFTNNVIYFDSIASLDDVPLDGKFKTAQDEARAKIAAKNKALGSGKGGARSTTRVTQSASAANLD